TVAVAEPSEKDDAEPSGTAVNLQMLAPDASRVAVMMSVLSLMTVLPFASVTEMVRTEVDTPSAAIGLRLRAAVVLGAEPGAVVGTMTLQPVRPVPETETCALPAVVVVVKVIDATPDDGVTTCVPVGVWRVGVSFAKVRFGELALLTVLPFASLSVAVYTIVLLPFAV